MHLFQEFFCNKLPNIFQTIKRDGKFVITLIKLNIYGNRGIIFSDFKDENIFHFFHIEIYNLLKLMNFCFFGYPKKIILKKYIEEHYTNNWRYEFFRFLGFEVVCQDNFPSNQSRIIDLQTRKGFYNPSRFQDLKRSRLFDIIDKKISEKLIVDINDKKLLYIARKTSRFVYDIKSKEYFDKVLIDYCNRNNISLKIVFFEDMTPREQFLEVANAFVILSVHGAGLTNIVFSKSNSTIIEINFRRFWHCDPVCDEHFNNLIDYRCPCGAPRSFDEFQKADFHNLTKLKGLKYYEVEIEDADGFRSRNPIDLQNIYVDPDKIFRLLSSIYKKIDK